MHSDGTWNDLELQRNNENHDAYACILTILKTTFVLKTIFETALRKIVHVCTFNQGAWSRPTFPWKCDNKDDKWCILTLIDTIFWSADTILKEMNLNINCESMLNGAVWCFWDLCSTSVIGGARLVPPPFRAVRVDGYVLFCYVWYGGHALLSNWHVRYLRRHSTGPNHW